MRKCLLVALLALFSVGSAFAFESWESLARRHFPQFQVPEHIQPDYFRHVLRRMWDDGDGDCDRAACCRHAAEAVYVIAKSKGLDAVKVRWDTHVEVLRYPSGPRKGQVKERVTIGHIIPGVKFGNTWHFYDASSSGVSHLTRRRSLPASRFPPDKGFVRNLSGRRMISDLSFIVSENRYVLEEIRRAQQLRRSQ